MMSQWLQFGPYTACRVFDTFSHEICSTHVGNATARFIRCTSYSFPVEAESAQQSHLPLAAIFCPLARPENNEVRVHF